MRRCPVALALGAGLIVAAQPALAVSSVPHRAVTSGAASTITFDSLPAPCIFEKTKPLRDKYSHLGVHFRGPKDREGGAILRRCGGFGVPAHSGRKFLAFNGQTYAKVPETITFDSAVSRVGCYVATGEPVESSFRLTAWRNGHQVASKEVVTSSDTYVHIGVHAPRGIDTVVVDASTPDANTFVLDDLSFVTLG